MANNTLYSSPQGFDIIEVVNTSGAAINQYLPVPAGRQIMVVKDGGGNAGTYPITILDSLGKLIDGSASYVLNMNYQSITLYYNGSAWRVI